MVSERYVVYDMHEDEGEYALCDDGENGEVLIESAYEGRLERLCDKLNYYEKKIHRQGIIIESLSENIGKLSEDNCLLELLHNEQEVNEQLREDIKVLSKIRRSQDRIIWEMINNDD